MQWSCGGSGFGNTLGNNTVEVDNGGMNPYVLPEGPAWYTGKNLKFWIELDRIKILHV